MWCVVYVVVVMDYVCDVYVYVVYYYVEVVDWCVVWVCDYEVVEFFV